ncbi:thymidine kinase [Patescibacteria group bacterium]|nr:thymidine kinase [Patescibacteria group bacterium]MBU4023250.1 thymidine kinase [Patescibacteria group bacterium]MBU4078072.1 thymidine kinase [Patescibacteria group bacterium]
MSDGIDRQLEVVTGCMFSGKTEKLIWRLERVMIANRRALLFKPTIDTRYDENAAVSHSGRKLEAHLLKPGNETLEALKELVGEETLNEADVVAFDEGNFFSEKLPALCEQLVTMGKYVIVAGLDLNFAEKPFEPMPALMALADTVDKLHAVCVQCGRDATRTQRIWNGNPVSGDQPEILVGGSDAYEARCRNCYVKP